MKYVQKDFWKEHLCVFQGFLCVHISQPVCARTHAQLRGNIGGKYSFVKYLSYIHCLGVWCKELIKEGTKFGPFVGEKAYEVDDSMDPAYIWEVSESTRTFL